MKNNAVLTSFFKYVSLNILGMIGLSFCILTDTFFISRGVGANGLTSLNLAIPIYSLITAVAVMIGIGAATKYAILKSQNDHNEANSFFTHAFIFGIGIGVLLLIFGASNADTIGRLMGADEITHKMTTSYLRTLFCFAPFYITNNVLLAFIRNDNAPKLAMAGTIIGNFGNIIFDYIFIFPFQMGMFGAALATGFSPVISIIILSTHFIRKQNQFQLTRCRFYPKHLLKILALGVSSFINEISSGVVIVVFNIVILSLEGNIGVAAFGVITNLALVFIAVFNGISQGAQPLISTNYGQGNLKNVKKLLHYSVILSLIFAGLIYTITYIFTDGFIQIFNSEHNATLARLASDGMRLYFFAFFFVGINVIITSFLSSVESPAQSFCISSLRGFAAIIPVVFLLAKLFGMTGVWLAYPCAEAITLCIAIILLLKNPIMRRKRV